jgi:hypothetical protein
MTVPGKMKMVRQVATRLNECPEVEQLSSVEPQFALIVRNDQETGRTLHVESVRDESLSPPCDPLRARNLVPSGAATEWAYPPFNLRVRPFDLTHTMNHCVGIDVNP